MSCNFKSQDCCIYSISFPDHVHPPPSASVGLRETMVQHHCCWQLSQWLKRPTCDLQSLLDCVQTWRDGWNGWFLPSFLFCLFWTAYALLFSCFHAVPHDLVLGWTIVSLLLPCFKSMSDGLRSLFQVSLYRRKGWQAFLLPSVTSPCKMSLGMQPGSMRLSCQASTGVSH